MRAVVLTGYGGVERLEVREVPRPDPGPGQLLVRVRAAGVNPIDWKIRRGRLRLLLPARFPLILGFDVAGEVAAIGPEVTDFEPGDPVFAMLDSRHGGGYAEYAVAGQDAAAPRPEGLSYEEAAAVPLAALTALQALRDVAELQDGERVAIVGAAGGVGHFGVQIAAAMGARVTAVAGPGREEFLRRLGAERAVDSTREDFTALDGGSAPAAPGHPAAAGGPTRTDYRAAATSGEGRAEDAGGPDGAEDAGDPPYAVIFDAAGFLRFGDCEAALAPGGVYVTTRRGPAIFIAGLRTALARLIDRGGARRAAPVLARPSAGDLAALTRLIDSGRLHPAVDHVYPLDEVRQAHAASEGGHTRGKLVLRLDG